MIDNTAVFTSELGERVIALEKGDRFFLFTDGLIETRVPDGSLFGTDRVKELLRGVGDKGPDAVVRLVEETVEECSEGRGPSDDMALLCFMIR
jgi:sigma-B regulation protein RsbU (phosphoserine phosphatase)